MSKISAQDKHRWFYHLACKLSMDVFVEQDPARKSELRQKADDASDTARCYKLIAELQNNI